METVLLCDAMNCIDEEMLTDVAILRAGRSERAHERGQIANTGCKTGKSKEMFQYRRAIAMGIALTVMMIAGSIVTSLRRNVESQPIGQSQIFEGVQPRSESTDFPTKLVVAGICYIQSPIVCDEQSCSRVLSRIHDREYGFLIVREIREVPASYLIAVGKKNDNQYRIYYNSEYWGTGEKQNQEAFQSRKKDRVERIFQDKG